MNLKKGILVVTILIFINTVLGSCFNRKIEERNKKYNHNIGMVAIEGGVKDKSFNELTYKGLLKVKEEYGVNFDVVETENKNEYQTSLKKLAQQNDLIYGVGFGMKDAIEKVASNEKNKNFVIVDAESELQNVRSIIFKDEEGSFLMGVIAGKMSKTNKVGFIGGIEEIPTQKFKSGYIAGVDATNSIASEELKNKKNIRYIGNFNDYEKAYELAKHLYNDGCDIIYHVAGFAGIGVFKAAKETGNFVIGVDQDQALTIPEYKDIILSSMIKNVDKACYETAVEDLYGNFKGGLDNKLELGLKEDGLGVAESTKNSVPKNILDLVKKYRKAIIDGYIVIPKTPDEVKEFKRQNLN